MVNLYFYILMKSGLMKNISSYSNIEPNQNELQILKSIVNKTKKHLVVTTGSISLKILILYLDLNLIKIFFLII